MKYRHALVALLLIVSLAACKSAGAPVSHAASLDQEVELAPTEQAVFDAHGLSVEFVRVLEDSRCPTDATCVWAGEVKVQLSIRIGTAAAEQQEVTVGQPATVGEFQLLIVKVQPERVSTREISAEQYRIALQVTHAK